MVPLNGRLKERNEEEWRSLIKRSFYRTFQNDDMIMIFLLGVFLVHCPHHTMTEVLVVGLS